MALPTRGQHDWDDDLNNYIAGLEARLQAAEANAASAQSNANYAKNKADTALASSDSLTADNVTNGAATKAALNSSTAAQAARLVGVQAVASADAALAPMKHNPVDASGGNRTMTLADATDAGQMVVVSKKDASVNTVTVSVAHLRDGGAGSITLVGQFEAITFTSKADGSWWPIGDHKTKAYFDATYAPNTWRAHWGEQVMAKPRAFNLPEITVAATSVSALGSGYVTYKPAIVGIGSQTLTWNGASDTNIRYGGGPGTTTTFHTANGGSNDLGLYGDGKPGGGAQAASWPVIYEFQTLSPQVEIYCYHVAGDTFMVEVNGQLVDDAEMSHAIGTAGAGRINLTFPADSPAGNPRRIRIFAGQGHGLSEIRVPSGYTISKPPARLKTIAVIGDSWVNGSSGVGNRETFAARLLRMIDPEADHILAGIGGTGWVAGTDGGTPNPYSTRLSIVLASNPDVLVFYGSQNDGNVSVQSAVASALATCASVPKILVVPTLLAGYETQAASIKAACAAAGRTYIEQAAGLINGSGHIDAPVELAGNRSLFLNSATDLHMSLRGHRFAAKAIHSLIPSTVPA